MVHHVIAFRRLLFLAATAVLLVGGWMGAYASSRGLTQSWRDAIRREFARQGLTLSMGKLTLDPIHGLVARDVRFYDDPEQQRVLADISRIDLDVSLPKLVRRELSVERLHVRNAMASIPLDPDEPNGERLEISEFDARVLFSDDRVEVQEMRGRLHGLLCSLTGELIRKPKTDAARHTQPPRPKFGLKRLDPAQAKAVVEALSVLRRMHWEKGRPAELQVRAVADLSDLDVGRFEFSFHAPVLAWDDIRAEEVGVRGRYEAGLLTVEDLRFRDNGGSFRAEADFVRATRTLRFNIDSHAYAVERLRRRWWPARFPAVGIVAAPILAAGGNVVLPKDWSQGKLDGLVTGSLALGRSTYAGTPIEYASATFSATGDRLLLRNLRVRQEESTLEGMLAVDGRFLQMRGTTDIRPEALAEIIPDRIARRSLGFFECGPGSSRRIDFAIAGTIKEARSWTVDLSFAMQGIRYQGIPFTSARSDLRIRPGQEIRFTDPVVEIAAGAPLVHSSGKTPAPTRARARSVVIKPASGNTTTTLDDLECTGWPDTVLAAFVPETARKLPPCRFDSAATLTADGTVGQDLKASSDLRITVRSEGLAYWPFLGRELPLQKPRLALALRDANVEIASVEARFLGGRINGEFLVRNVHQLPVGCRGRVMLDAVNHPELIALFGKPDEDAKGSVDLVFDFDTKECSTATLGGKGTMNLHDADLFSIPLFGPLSPLVEAVLPDLGVGYSVASTAGCTYTVREGVLTTEDFAALTPSFKMDGHGTVNLNTQAVDFSARLNARGLAKVATVLLSYIFEYKCEGNLQAPVWRPVHIPRVPIPKLPKIRLPSLLPGGRRPGEAAPAADAPSDPPVRPSAQRQKR